MEGVMSVLIVAAPLYGTNSFGTSAADLRAACILYQLVSERSLPKKLSFREMRPLLLMLRSRSFPIMTSGSATLCILSKVTYCLFISAFNSAAAMTALRSCSSRNISPATEICRRSLSTCCCVMSPTASLKTLWFWLRACDIL